MELFSNDASFIIVTQCQEQQILEKFLRWHRQKMICKDDNNANNGASFR